MLLMIKGEFQFWAENYWRISVLGRLLYSRLYNNFGTSGFVYPQDQLLPMDFFSILFRVHTHFSSNDRFEKNQNFVICLLL